MSIFTSVVPALKQMPIFLPSAGLGLVGLYLNPKSLSNLDSFFQASLFGDLMAVSFGGAALLLIVRDRVAAERQHLASLHAITGDNETARHRLATLTSQVTRLDSAVLSMVAACASAVLGFATCVGLDALFAGQAATSDFTLIDFFARATELDRANIVESVANSGFLGLTLWRIGNAVKDLGFYLISVR